jgi:hypothetical protein
MDVSNGNTDIQCIEDWFDTFDGRFERRFGPHTPLARLVV